MVCCFPHLLASSNNRRLHNPTAASHNGHILNGEIRQCRMRQREVGQGLALAPAPEAVLELEA